jgi:hypothetical protein
VRSLERGPGGVTVASPPVTADRRLSMEAGLQAPANARMDVAAAICIRIHFILANAPGVEAKLKNLNHYRYFHIST